MCHVLASLHIAILRSNRRESITTNPLCRQPLEVCNTDVHFRATWMRRALQVLPDISLSTYSTIASLFVLEKEKVFS